MSTFTNPLDALLEPTPARRYTCAIREILDSLEEPYKSALEEKLANRANSHEGIRKVLRNAGFPLGQTTIQRHRAGTCRCFTSNGEA